MRVALAIKKIDEIKAEVYSVNYVYKGYETENMIYFEGIIPEPIIYSGKSFTMFIDLSKHNIFYEYYDRPLTPEEDIQFQYTELKAAQDLMKIAMADLIMGGM